VLLGPIEWRARFIQSELNDLYDNGEKATSYTISPTESGYVDCSDGFEIFPITSSTGDAHDPVFEQLEGPFYTYSDNQATETYNVVDRDITFAKVSLKSLATVTRRGKQVLGITVTIGDNTVNVGTDDTELQKYVAALAAIGTDTINWKFNGSFIELNAASLQAIIDAIRSYVQAQFDWEKGIYESIDAANDLTTLKAITIE
jgi:hypothetical protein